MNFYATREYLDVISEVYFKGRPANIEDVRVGDEVLRLLVVDGKRVVTDAKFLDYHEPLEAEAVAHATRAFAYSNFVVRGVVEPPKWEECRQNGFELALYVDWSMFPALGDYKDFILGRNRGLIREFERRGRRLAEQVGPIVFQMNDDSADVLALARLWKKSQLRRSGEDDYFADPRTMECLELLRKRGLLTTSTLRAGRRLASVYVGFVHDRIWSGWIFAYDPELQKYSCGHQLMSAMLKQSYHLGHRQFDLSIGSEPYKTVYATHARVLGTIGQPPVRQRFVKRLKRELKVQTPKVFEAAQAAKRGLLRQKSIYESWLRGTEVLQAARMAGNSKGTDGVGYPPAGTAPPRDLTGPKRVKAIVSRAASTVLLPVVQRLAREHIGGEALDDAIGVAEGLAARGIAGILGFWDAGDDILAEVTKVYLATIARLSGSGLDAYLSLKAPALRFDLGAVAEIVAAARAANIRVHFDSHAPEAVEASYPMLLMALSELGPQRVGTTIPGRWTRSVRDLEWAIERGLNIRIVKGQWPDPLHSRNMQAGLLDVIDRAAGRARHVAIATHDLPLASQAMDRLRAAGTPCEFEQIIGMTTAHSMALAGTNAISTRVYIPFGRGYAPNAFGMLRRNPRLAWTIAKRLAGTKASTQS